MRPYRLINFSELQFLQQRMQQIVQLWCTQYSITNVDCELLIPNIEHVCGGWAINFQDEIVALTTPNSIDFITTILFGENERCLHAVSEELFLLLMHNLLDLENLSLDNTLETEANWFYRGSTSLQLILSNQQNSLTIVLSPQHIYQFLSLNRSLSVIESIDNALDKQVLTLDIELMPLSLSINELLNLQAGDVLASDHSLTTPLQLIHDEQLIAQCELGTTAEHKTLLLKRPQ